MRLDEFTLPTLAVGLSLFYEKKKTVSAWRERLELARLGIGWTFRTLLASASRLNPAAKLRRFHGLWNRRKPPLAATSPPLAATSPPLTANWGNSH